MRGYASHIYDWRTSSGKRKFRRVIVDILKDIDKDSERPDNPVSDFLVRTSAPQLQPAIELKTSESGLSIVGPDASKLNISDIVKHMAEENR